jgi:predicted dehydrogenase
MSAPHPNPLRIGVLGAAGILRKKNWQAIKCSGNAVIAALATRDLARTREVVAERQAAVPFPEAPKAHASYEALLADPTIEAVYLPLPTAVRKEWIIRAANAGKHIISEKPTAISAADLGEIFNACRARKVQFMDGVMFDHNPRLKRVLEMLDDPVRIGPVQRITSVFSFLGTGDFQEKNIRVAGNLEPVGCLGDLGWYCLRASLWAMRWQRPVSAMGRIHAAAPDGTPIDFSGELHFADGVSAGFHCSFRAYSQQWVNISGVNGTVRVPDFVNPSSDCPVAWEVNFQPVPKRDLDIHLGTATTSESQESLMFRDFANQVRSGTVNEEWFKVAWENQLAMDACLASARAEGRLVTLPRD